MTQKEIENAIYAVLFVCGEPIEVATFVSALDVDLEEIEEALERITKKSEDEGIVLRRTEDKLQLCTNPKYASYVKNVVNPVKKEALSLSVIETLSIIAYKQPVTRGDIEAIRGVRSNYAVSTLLDLNLIKESGRKDVLGKPSLLITTDAFLRHFGIASLEELPIINFEEYSKTEETE